MIKCPIPGLLENGNFTNTSAYFLGSILAGDESYRVYRTQKRVWLAVVKHNAGYCTSAQLKEHYDALSNLARTISATVYTKNQLVNKNWFTPNKVGFAVGFESENTISAADLISYVGSLLPSLSGVSKKCLLLGAFDGRCSIDVNKSTGQIRYLVLDCGNDQAMEFFTGILDMLYIKYNCNYARDRLEGGIPRKPQLRIAAASVGVYAQRIGFISTARMEILKRAMGIHYEETDDEVLPGKKILSYAHSLDNRTTPIKSIVPPMRQKSAVTSLPTSTPINELPQIKQNTVPVPKINVSVGDEVIHKSFGKGKVILLDESYISVNFNGSVKKFVFPNAFTDGFLKLHE